MNPMQKNVVPLRAGLSLSEIDALYLAGMHLALLDGSYPQQELNRLVDAVKQTFLTHNDPIGLVIRLQPGMEPENLSEYQYVLLDGCTPAQADSWIQRHRETFQGQCVAAISAAMQDWETVADGILTDDPQLAAQARELGMLVLTENQSLQADALLWPKDTPAQSIACRRENPRWVEAALLARYASCTPDLAFGCVSVLSALRCGAKAILLFTTDGKNIPAVSSLYPPIPIIAIAKRPEKEQMLLCQTMRWAVLPTAITKTPESMDVEAFARFVAQLYGYRPGDSFVAAGHWVPGQNQEQLHCFTL